MPDTRKATPAEVAAYERGEQKVWECPECGHRAEVLSALMVWCTPCQETSYKLVQMARVPDTEVS
jgi:ribosomal protein L37AE/L43A